MCILNRCVLFLKRHIILVVFLSCTQVWIRSGGWGTWHNGLHKPADAHLTASKAIGSGVFQWIEGRIQLPQTKDWWFASLFFLHSATFSVGQLPFFHTYSNCSIEALPFLWGMRFKTDQSRTASPWTLWLVQGWPKTKASWVRVNVMTFLGDKRKGYLLFPAGLAPGSFCNYSRCHHREPQNKSDNKAREERSRKSGSWWHDLSPCMSACLFNYVSQ